MNPHLDHATAIRTGEELPIDRLASHLKQHLPQLAGTLTIEQFAHGHSNLTYLLKLGSTELVRAARPSAIRSRPRTTWGVNIACFRGFPASIRRRLDRFCIATTKTSWARRFTSWSGDAASSCEGTCLLV